jgi:hypothetical protein
MPTVAIQGFIVMPTTVGIPRYIVMPTKVGIHG